MNAFFVAPVKDPGAYLDYFINWTGWLTQGETISDFTVSSSDAALVIDSETHADGVVTWWADGGVAGFDYLMTCAVETSAGRKDQRSVKLPVRER